MYCSGGTNGTRPGLEVLLPVDRMNDEDELVDGLSSRDAADEEKLADSCEANEGVRPVLMESSRFSALQAHRSRPLLDEKVMARLEVAAVNISMGHTAQ